MRVRGSGIGLALVENIAKSHKGSAWVESEPGKGASFFLAFPVRSPSHAKTASQQKTVANKTNDTPS
jgi:signal transduction histidine kinase